MTQARKAGSYLIGLILFAVLLLPAEAQSIEKWPNESGTVLGATALSPQADPNLIVTDIWPDEEGNICYQLMNTGKADAPAGHSTSLTVDGAPLALEAVNEVLSPGARFSTCFIQDWICTDPDDTVVVHANKLATISESNYDDNERTEIFKCDRRAPAISSPPSVSEVGSSSVRIDWTTDEEADSSVEYDTVIGNFQYFESSDKPTTTHAVMLYGLAPKTTYQFRVRSSDASGNEAVSEAGFFETLTEPDSTEPTAGTPTTERQAGDYLNYLVQASASDNQKVERVEFYLDGSLIGSDFTPGDKGSAPGVYSADLVPALLGMDSTSFFTEHSLVTRVYDAAGLWTEASTSFTPPPDPFRGNVEILAPADETILYIPGTTVPVGTSVNIRALAERTEENCYRTNLMDPNAPHPIRCDRYSVLVGRVVMRIVPPSGPTVTLCDFVPAPGSTGRIYECAWTAAGNPTGTYTIQVQAYGPGGTTLVDSQYLEVQTGSAALEVTRHVSRTANSFQVSLDLHNPGTLPLTLHSLTDHIRGFQPIYQTSGDWLVTGNYSSYSQNTTLTITPNAGGSSTLIIPPGSTETVSYLAIPVLFDSYLSVSHQFGSVDAAYTASGASGTQSYLLNNASTDTGEDLETAVLRARQAASYLIISNPSRYYPAFLGVGDDDAILSGMAKLAFLKNGILGYTEQLTGSGADRQATSWGSEMLGSDGIARHWASNGYLLIVGETEVIGSFDDYITHWILSNRTIHYSDNNFGDTTGDLEPDVMVGRLQGDNPAEILTTLNNIIEVANGTPGYVFDRSDALVVAGQGDGENSFESSADNMRNFLDDHYSVTFMTEDYMEDHSIDMKDWMQHAVSNQDVIVYRDHCSGDSWGDVVTKNSLSFGPDEWNFGTHRPFVFAICCEAGRYKDVGDYGILESVMYKGANVYIGATEVSDRITNNDYGEYFFQNWSTSSATIGAVLKQAENNFDGFYDDSWRDMYNLYGDPSYGGGSFSIASPQADPFLGVPLQPQGGITEAEINVPAYSVEASDGGSLVTFDGAAQELVIGYPVTPRYPVRFTIPDGMWVNSVRLTAQAHSETISNLTLKTGAEEVDDGKAVQPAQTLQPQTEVQEWPESDYDWQIETTADGTSVLVITVRPLRYYPLQAEGQFTNQFTFDVTLIDTTASILSVQPVYPWYFLDEAITATLWVSVTAVPQDLLVSASVVNLADGKTLAGAPALALDGAVGLSQVQIASASTGLGYGQHTLMVELRDSQGQVMSRAYSPFVVGYAAAAVDQLNLSKEFFVPGETVGVGINFQNVGNVPLSGTIVAKIQKTQGGDPVLLTQDFSAVDPWGIVYANLNWDTTGEPYSDYVVSAYALFNSQSTEILTANITSYKKIYLPVVKR